MRNVARFSISYGSAKGGLTSNGWIDSHSGEIDGEGPCADWALPTPAATFLTGVFWEASLLDTNFVDSSLQARPGDFLRRDAPRLKSPIKNNMAEQPVAEVFTFPTNPAEFENDDRISFSKLDNKFIAVQESDGTEFEFDHQLKRWIPVADEDEEAFIQQHQDAYGSAQDPSADSSAQPSNGRKRKQDQVEVSCARWSVHSGRDNP